MLMTLISFVGLISVTTFIYFTVTIFVVHSVNAATSEPSFSQNWRGLRVLSSRDCATFQTCFKRTGSQHVSPNLSSVFPATTQIRRRRHTSMSASLASERNAVETNDLLITDNASNGGTKSQQIFFVSEALFVRKCMRFTFMEKNHVAVNMFLTVSSSQCHLLNNHNRYGPRCSHSH